MSMNFQDTTYSVRWCGISGFSSIQFSTSGLRNDPEKVGQLKQWNGGGAHLWEFSISHEFFEVLYI